MTLARVNRSTGPSSGAKALLPQLRTASNPSNERITASNADTPTFTWIPVPTSYVFTEGQQSTPSIIAGLPRAPPR